MKKCIIIANGRIPRNSDIKYLKDSGYNTIFCADGGSNAAFRLKIIPDYIIGDLDSAKPEVLKYYSDKTKIIKFAGQDDTDVEKCLKYAIGQDFTHCCMLGVIGNRLDHSFCNLGIAIKFSDRINLSIISENSWLEVISGYVEYKSLPEEIVSLYGFNENTTFYTNGLKYKLVNEPLPFGVRESTSNVSMGDRFSVEIKGGKAFLIRSLKAVRKCKE